MSIGHKILYTVDEVRHSLVESCRNLGSQKAWAEEHGIGLATVNDAVRGRTDIPPKIAKAMGLKKIFVYVPDEDEG